VPATDGGLGTVDIQNPPAKAISRLTNAQFIHSAAALVGDAAVAGVDTLLPEQTIQGAFRNAGYAQQLPFDLIKAFDAAATYVVNQVTDWPTLYQRWGACTQQACISTFIQAFSEAAFRRPTTTQDVQAFQPILTASTTAGLTYDETVKLLVRAILQAPEFLYLFEDPTLTDFQLASRVSYFLTDGPPDAQLYAAAKSGALRTSLSNQVDRLLAMDVTAFARAFGYDYLELQQAPTRNLTADLATVNQLISSAVDSFAALVSQNQPIASILTTDTFATNAATATWIAGQPSTATTVKPTQAYPFMGMLTHPATLIAISNSVFGSTVSRGQFVATQMLCVPPTPPPPPGIQQTDLSAALPPNPTQRDIAEARIADQRCSGCHSQFETYSFAFNKWGGDGLFKTDPKLNDNGPVKTGLGQIAFKGYADYLPQLAGSAQFQRCVTDHLIRYGLQHTEYPPDLVQTILSSAQTAGGGVTFRSLMRGLVLQTIFTTK
jgi:hypothetical protein